MHNLKIILLSWYSPPRPLTDSDIYCLILFYIGSFFISLLVLKFVIFLVNKEYPQNSIIDFNIVKYWDSLLLKNVLVGCVPMFITANLFCIAIIYSLGDQRAFPGIFISCAVSLLVNFILMAYYAEPFYNRLKSIVMLKLVQDGFAKEKFCKGYYISIFPFREDIKSNKNMPVDLGWLTVDENKLAFNGIDYKIEMLKSDILEIFIGKFRLETFFKVKLICVKYQEKNRETTTLKMYSNGGMTAPKIRQSNIELFKILENWFNA